MADAALAAYVPRLLLGRGDVGPGHWQLDGTLLFADVSGFTRLTEKLSRHGKVGGEEIVRTISDVFTVLLTATADGGDVLKFSGDALLLFYDSADHAQRACHAALAMQRVLRAVGGIDSSRGRVRLRMSVGVHTGRFSFFLCGGDHLELFVLGGATSTTVAAEAAARAGEVLVSPATAAALQGAAFGACRGDTVILRSLPPLQPCGPPLPLLATPDAAAATARRFVAPPLRDRLDDDGEPEHEHRRATVAFAHFAGIDDLVAGAGAAATFDRVQSLTEVTMRALDEYGVLLTATDVAVDGGTIMLTAGVPDATGDDAARMLRVARRILDADHGLAVHIGVNAGDVFVGAVGAPFRRTYSTMGEATNLAARLMRAAPAGSVLASRTVLDEVGERFVSAPVTPFAVKGHAGLVEAGTVQAVVSASTAAADRTIGFVGRTEELAELQAAVADVRAGRGRIVEISGAAGLGKSRLIAELRARSDDLGWYQTACDPYERTSPYRSASALLRQMLRIPVDATGADAGAALTALVDDTTPDLSPWLPLLATAIEADVAPTTAAAQVAPRFRRERIQQAVGDLLGTAVAGPVALVVDDAQHADDASAELLAALLARFVPSDPWLVAIARSEGTAGLHAGRGYEATPMHLAPLGATATAELAARLAEHTAVPVHRMPELIDRAAGNPLFLAALVSAQTDTATQLPRSVDAIIAARIDELDPDDRRALRHLSVLGDRFDADLLDAALGPVELTHDQHDRWRRLAEFVTVDGDSFAFRNALIREVAYEGLPFHRRRRLHALVADALRSSAVAARSPLPLHLLRAERWREAWTAARQAAEHARSAGANAVAGELYDMALLAARRCEVADAELSATAAAAGNAWELAGIWASALRAYEIAARAAPDRAGRLDVALCRARTYEDAGRYPQALRLYRRVISATADAPADLSDRVLARAHGGYASTRLRQGRARAAVDSALAAMDHAERADDDAALAQAYHLLDRAHTMLGDHDTAAAYRDAALPVFAALGDLAAQGTVLHDLGRAAQRAGRLDEALWLHERAHDARSQAGDVVRVAGSACAIGEVLLAMDRTDDARQRFSEALRAWRGARAPDGIAEATRNLGLVALRRGRYEQAVELLQDAADLALRIGTEQVHEHIQLPLADALLASQRYVEAWDTASQVLAATNGRGAATARRIRGEALLRTGGRARAHEELQAALAGLTGSAVDAVRSLLDEAAPAGG